MCYGAVFKTAVGDRGTVNKVLMSAVDVITVVDFYVLKRLVLVLLCKRRPLFLGSLKENLPKRLIAAEDPVLHGLKAGRKRRACHFFTAAEGAVVDDGHMGRHDYLL